MSEDSRPIESDSKSEMRVQEEAYDRLAEEHGIDENGDEIVDIDDDEPVLQDDEREEEPEQPDTPEPEAADHEERAAEQPQTDPNALIPPHTWKPEWKEQFNKITDPIMKSAILEQNKNMNRAFTERMTELAGVKRDLMGVQNSLKPHQDRLERAGISPDVAIQRSLAWDAHIQRNPQQGIMDMAKAYGVDMSKFAQPQQQEYMTPTERRLAQEAQQANQSVQQVQQQLAQWQQMQQQQEFSQRQSNAYHMLNEFMNARDEAGNPRHPYIEHVAPMMTHLIQNGTAPDLETAYDMAEKWSPDIQAAKERMRQAEQVRAAQAKAKKVRQASRSGIVGKTGTKKRADQDFEQQLSRTYDKIANA